MVEVEQVMEEVVNDVLDINDSLSPRRSEIMDMLVQALEKDASWVSLYEITGELDIPGLTAGEDGIERVVKVIKEVSPPAYGPIKHSALTMYAAA